MGTVGHADRQQYRVGGYFGGIPGGRNQYPGCGSVSGLGGWRYGRLFSVILETKTWRRANKAAGQLVFVTFFLSLLMAVICIAFHEPILRAIFGKVEKEVMDNAKIYFLFSAVAFPFIALYDDGASICVPRRTAGSRCRYLSLRMF